MALTKPFASSCPSKNCCTAWCIGVSADCGYAWSQDSWNDGACLTRSNWYLE